MMNICSSYVWVLCILCYLCCQAFSFHFFPMGQFLISYIFVKMRKCVRHINLSFAENEDKEMQNQGPKGPANHLSCGTWSWALLLFSHWKPAMLPIAYVSTVFCTGTTANSRIMGGKDGASLST